MAAAAKCFFAFVGFDSIASTGMTCFEGNTIFTSGNQGRRPRMPRSLFHSALIWHYWLSSSPILASPLSSLSCGLTIFRIPIFRLYTHLNRLAGTLLQRQSVSVLYSVWLQGIIYYSPYIHCKMCSTNVKVIILNLAFSLLGAMIPLPRVIYAIAKDGLMFRFLAKINPKFQVSWHFITTFSQLNF